MKKYIYSAVALLGFSSLTLTSCQNENEPDNVAGNKVLLTITANRGEAETRTILEENGTGGLNCYWSEGDQLVVADSQGKKIGVVTLESVDDTNRSKGVFKGEVELGSDGDINLIYVGSSVNAETGVATGATTIALDVSQQDGTLASLTEKDVLCAETNVINANGSAQADVQMERRVAHGYFALGLPDGLTLDAGDVITITGTGSSVLKTQKELKFVNGGSIAAIADAQYKGATSITITKAESGNSFYVTILPFAGNYALTPTFTVVKDGYKYTASLGNHTWKYGEYVRKNTNGDPVEVTEWTKEKLPVNPADFNNWPSPFGDDDKAASWIVLKENEREFNRDGRYTNERSVYGYGGWATYVKITNGIQTNLLTSYDGAAIFFQWGRKMGFPSNIAKSPNMPLESNNSYGPTSTAAGTYQFHYEYDYTDWNYTESNKYPYVFSLSKGATSNLDWWSVNNECKWEDCSGNPCPDEYRIPTAEELSVLVPTKVIDGSLVEYKTVNGIRYAFEWLVITTNGNPYVTVRSAPTDRTDVNPRDEIFNDSNIIVLQTYGYISLVPLSLRTEFGYVNKGSWGLYWSSDSGTANEALSSSINISGNGGKALAVQIAGTKAAIAIKGWPRTYGACIMPIKDSTAKGQTYKPWFPYYGTWF